MNNIVIKVVKEVVYELKLFNVLWAFPLALMIFLFAFNALPGAAVHGIVTLWVVGVAYGFAAASVLAVGWLCTFQRLDRTSVCSTMVVFVLIFLLMLLATGGFMPK